MTRRSCCQPHLPMNVKLADNCEERERRGTVDLHNCRLGSNHGWQLSCKCLRRMTRKRMQEPMRYLDRQCQFQSNRFQQHSTTDRQYMVPINDFEISNNTNNADLTGGGTRAAIRDETSRTRTRCALTITAAAGRGASGTTCDTTLACTQHTEPTPSRWDYVDLTSLMLAPGQ